MIIVDLDKLHFPFTTARPEYAQGVQDLHKAILKCKIDAIPVEWIRKWLENIKNEKRYKSEYVELTQDVKQVVYKGNVLIRIPCISDMLEDWEKENEIG